MEKTGKRYEQEIHRRVNQRANKCIKKCSTSLMIKEKKIV